jgi:hypothetical protein
MVSVKQTRESCSALSPLFWDLRWSKVVLFYEGGVHIEHELLVSDQSGEQSRDGIDEEMLAGDIFSYLKFLAFKVVGGWEGKPHSITVPKLGGEGGIQTGDLEVWDHRGSHYASGP